MFLKMKELSFKLKPYSNNLIDVVSQYIYYMYDYDFIQKNIISTTNYVEVSYFKNGKLILVSEEHYKDINYRAKTLFNSSTVIIDDNEFILQQLKKFGIIINKDTYFYYSNIEESIKPFITLFLDYYKNYTIFSAGNNYIDSIKTINFTLDKNILAINQFNVYKNKIEGKQFNILPNNLIYDDNYIYTYDPKEKLNILYNAKKNSGFYYNFVNELLVNNRFLVTENVNALIKTKNNILYSHFFDFEQAINFCFYLDINNVDCLLHNNNVYYMSKMYIKPLYDDKNRIDYCAKYDLKKNMSYIKIIIKQNKLNYTTIEINNTEVKYNLKDNLYLSFLHTNCYQIIKKNISLATICIDDAEKEKFEKLVRKKYRKGYFLTPYEKFIYYKNKKNTIQTINIELLNSLISDYFSKSSIQTIIKDESKNILQCNFCQKNRNPSRMLTTIVKGQKNNICNVCYNFFYL